MTTPMSSKGSKRATITYTEPQSTADNADQRGPKKHPARRWVVERTHAWHNRFRRLLVRWEKKSTHYQAFIHVASVLIIFQLVERLT